MFAPAPKLRVLHVIPSLGRGGAERQVVDLVRNSDPKRFEHIVCQLGGATDFAAAIVGSGNVVVNFGLTARRPWIAATWQLLAMIRKWQPSVVNAWLLDATIAARMTRLITPSLPLVISLANADYESETIARAKWPPARVAVLQAIDVVTSWLSRPEFVACSEFVSASASRHLLIPQRKIRTIFNSVDVSTLTSPSGSRETLRRELGIPPSALVFLNVGRLDPQKGQDLLLRAFARVLKSCPHAVLAIVGGGPLEESLQVLARDLAVVSQTRFLGVRDDVGACLAMADVFVFPSLFEGFGIALVEAMSQGLPCIATRVGPIPEIVTNEGTGLLVDCNSIDELATAMERLADDPALRQALGARGRTGSERFCSAVVLPQWEALYENLARPNRALTPRNHATESDAL